MDGYRILGAALRADGERGHRGYERQASEGKAQHEAFCGVHVSINETRVCIVDDTGVAVREVKVATEPEELLSLLRIPPKQSSCRENFFTR